MLCLTRKTGQKVVIGDGIVIQIVQVQNGIVRLGITAPEDMPIDREEIAERKKRERQL